MSTFNPPPTDGLSHCGGQQGCPKGSTCFLYSGGTICQPFTPPTYPATGANATIVNPPGWYVAGNYPSIRYTGDLTNQTAGANCTTIPVPQNDLYISLVRLIVSIDLGSIISLDFDQGFSSTLVQYRGNCAQDFYCQPSQPINTTQTDYSQRKFNVQGSLPGTCQPLRAANQPCQSSNMCTGWHISANRTWNNDQYRCGPQTSTNYTLNPVGICQDQKAGSGSLDDDNPFSVQRTAKTYLLASLLLFCLIFLYLWYRRMKMRRRQEAMRMVYTVQPYDNTAIYTTRGGVNRAPDDNDNGELPSYGNHRRDERIVGQAAEEIGMYSFSTTQGAPQPPPQAGAYPAPTSRADRPVQHNYPFPMSHPSLTNNVFSDLPAGNALYPPPASDPPPLHQSAEEAQAAAVSAAAAAAIATPRPAAATASPTANITAAGLQAGGMLPPSYDATVPEGSTKTTEKERNPFETEAAAGARGSSSSSPVSTPHPLYGDDYTKERLPASSASSTHGSGSGSSSSGVPPPSSTEPKKE
ncbi:hypothetical protein BGZ83_002211 [Gryganskiella cystojenkinii]|nr:hypothetical protein BGZ83_002211 [Gryganskiella cystojenkinii]